MGESPEPLDIYEQAAEISIFRQSTNLRKIFRAFTMSLKANAV